MARKKAARINRSQLIRDYKEADGKAGPKAISEAMLADHGIKVSPQYVSTILTLAKKKGGVAGRPGRRAGRAGSLNHNKLMKAKEFMNLMGGAAEAKAAIALIDRLLG